MLFLTLVGFHKYIVYFKCFNDHYYADNHLANMSSWMQEKKNQ